MIVVQYMTIDNQWHTIIFSSVIDYQDWLRDMKGFIIEVTLQVS